MRQYFYCAKKKLHVFYISIFPVGAQNAPAAPANFFGNLTSFHQSPQIGQPSVGSTQLVINK